MPSDTAFLGDLRGGAPVANAYDSLGSTVDGMPRTPVSAIGSGARISPRELSSAVENLRALGIDIDENNRVLRGLRMGILTGYSLHMLYGAYIAIRRAEMFKEIGWATGETIAMAVAQQWQRIAQAVAAAAITYAAFKVGEKFGEGDWNLPSVNIKNPADRRYSARQVSGLGQ